MFPSYLHLSLPLLKGGDIALVLPAGLPEISGTFGFAGGSGARSVAGAFATQSSYNTLSHNNNTGNTSHILSFSAARSNPVYGNSITVQVSALGVIPQVKY